MTEAKTCRQHHVQISTIKLMIEEAFAECKEFEATIKEGENKNEIIKCY